MIVVFTLFTAFKVPLPRYLAASLSLNSNASWTPVEAPDGTIALPVFPDAKVSSTSTVGFPLESKTSRASTFWIVYILIYNNKIKKPEFFLYGLPYTFQGRIYITIG